MWYVFFYVITFFFLFWLLPYDKLINTLLSLAIVNIMFSFVIEFQQPRNIDEIHDYSYVNLIIIYSILLMAILTPFVIIRSEKIKV